MKHAPVTRAHRELAYEIIGWGTATTELDPWIETGNERSIPQTGIDAAQRIADLEARSRRDAWAEGYEAGRQNNTFGVGLGPPPLTPNPYPDIDP